MATSQRPLWQALHESGFAHAEVRRIVHTFTRKINADMVHVVGNKVLYQWEQDMEAFLKDKEDSGAPDRPRHRDARGRSSSGSRSPAGGRGKQRRPRDGRTK
jgi:hypothetical protein